MGWLRNNAFVISLGVLLVSGTLLAVVLGYVGLVVYSALGTGASMVGVLSGLAFPYLPIVAVLLVISVISAIGFGWGILRRLSIPRSERLETAAERAEQRYPMLDGLGLSERVSPPEPSTEDALEDLKRRYVAGELDEASFERKLDRLVANDSVDDVRAEREREAMLDEHSGERSS
jgi:uncharacterized membrane protein